MRSLECYLITWTTYGTRLPGDSRGYRTRKSKNTFSGTDEELHRWAQEHLDGDVVRLGRDGVIVVSTVLQEMFQKDERLILASVGSVHCHLLADIARDEISDLMNTVKGRSSFQLRSVGLRGRK